MNGLLFGVYPVLADFARFASGFPGAVGLGEGEGWPQRLKQTGSRIAGREYEGRMIQ